jgi:hypothetical protein
MTRRWLIDLPTRLHLWAAEQEIRHRSSLSDPDRLRNLDVLRDYRKSREFPRNDTGLRSTPYFVDREGRHCAVGHLMRMSGNEDAVRRIAATSNLARIDDLDPALLTNWTDRSGLTKRELARIQPTYPNEAQWLVNVLLAATLGLIPVAFGTLIVGRMRSDRFVLKWAQAAGILATVLALGYVVAGAVCLILANRGPKPDPGIPVIGDADYPVFLLPLGVAAVLVALAVLGGIVRTRWRMG